LEIRCFVLVSTFVIVDRQGLLKLVVCSFQLLFLWTYSIRCFSVASMAARRPHDSLVRILLTCLYMLIPFHLKCILLHY
jgi:hypothetical protein